jgi:light-regulated signal transduction histidine kinase (bacteriophytochrome)
MVHDTTLQAYVINYRDVTKRKKAEAALQDINNRLEDMVKDRTSDLDAFTHSVSHDLRSPVRAINGLAHMLGKTAKDVLNETSMKLINEISNETKHMNELIDDLMRLCQSGAKPPVLKQTDMNQLVQTTLSELMMGSESKAKITIHNLPHVQCDAGLMMQVWSNLISNAIKYSAKNTSPEIEIGCNQGEVFYIKDNGAGFDMKYAPKLFNVFQRLHSRCDFEGTGVGLSLVKRIIDKHCGEIWVEAAVGKGATFYFTLNTHHINVGKPNESAPPFPAS